jgi:flavin reductase (DIM6/NTAB) family NADH-FMN oxidoreductase RutF
MASQLFRFLTTTVGLVTARDELGVNVMAAEWTYFVARDPLHIAVGIGDAGYTQGLIEESGEFAVTICSASQAPLANFMGSFSGVDVDKSSSELLELVPGVAISTPRVAGGVFSAECRVTDHLDLPGYKLFVGEALAAEFDEDASLEPLVKHGCMYRLGEPISDETMVVAAELVDDEPPTIRVAASVQGGERLDAPWTVSLAAPDARRRVLGRVPSNEWGDLFEDLDLSDTWSDVPIDSCRVVVERPDARPGWATLSTRRLGAQTRPDNGAFALATASASVSADSAAPAGKGVK